MTEREVIIGFVSSVIGGLVAGLLVWIVQQNYLNRREKLKEQKQKLIKSSNTEKIATNDVFQDFGLGTSIEHMKSMLGMPNKFKRTDYPIFSEEEVNTNSYLYIFSNAYLKIISKDNETIDTLTLLSSDGSISIDNYAMPCEFGSSKLGEAKVYSELVEISNHTFIGTRWDSSFAFEFYTGAPMYEHYTLFGFSGENKFEYFESKDPKLFIGETIDGICISNSEEEVYFIYENEIR